jgi:glycosyltransferase involved in cell wall biosynthesis
MRLKIAAKVDAVDVGYFRDEIEPLLADPLIEFIEEIGDSEKSAFLGNAKALLFPIDWPEPFGLVLIEAMACGTPVIAWRCGSVSEIIENGKTGFIVDTEDEAVRAVFRLDQLDRQIVRKVFQERFTVMARNYLRLYWRLCAAAGRADVRRRTTLFWVTLRKRSRASTEPRNTAPFRAGEPLADPKTPDLQMCYSARLPP